MVNEFHFDRKREYEEKVKEVIRDIKPEHSDGASTVRFPWGGYMVKVAASRNGVFTPEAVEKNIELISNAGIQFPETILGVYDLSEFEPFWKGTPVVIQERAGMTFQQSFDDNGNPTEKTYFMLKRAIDVVDRAVAHDLVIDDSLSNFGIFGNTVVLMDVQDENSVKKNVKGEFEKMYQALVASLTRYGADKEKMEKIVMQNSKFY